MPLRKEGIRFVLWSGSKFIFFGEEDFRDKESVYMNLDGRLRSMADVSEFVSIVPVNFSCNLGIDGSGAMSMTFVAPYGKFDFRYRRQFDGKVKRQSLFREKLLDSYIKPFCELYYKHLSTFSDEYFQNVEGFSDPEIIFTLPQIVWVDLKIDDGMWYRVFTGMVNFVSEVETTGRTRTITVRATNFLQLTNKIPLIQQVQVVPMVEAYLSEDEVFRSFWKVYMMSVMISKDKRTIGWDPLADMNLVDIFRMFVQRINFALGCVDESDINQLKELVMQDQGLQNVMKLSDKDIKVYYDVVKMERYYDFKLFGYSDLPGEVDVYYGKDNMLVSTTGDLIGFQHLFQQYDVRKPCAVGKLMFSTIIKKLLEKDEKNKRANMPQVFKKIFQLNMKSIYKPDFVMLSNLVRKIASCYGFYSHTDPFGNWIVEYPNLDALPIIGSGDPHELLAYVDNDRRYILHPWECSSITYNRDPDRYITYLELPFQYNAPFNITSEVFLKPFIGRSWGSAKEFLQFGLNQVSLTNLYFSMGDISMNKEEFLGKLADMFRHRFNRDVETASVTKRLSPYYQVGRMCVIPHKEKKYLVANVNHSYTSGVGGSTTLNLIYGRSLHDFLGSPWEYFLENVTDIYDEVVDRPKDEVVSGIVVGNLEDTDKVVKELMNYIFVNFQDVKSDVTSVYTPLPPGPVRKGDTKAQTQLECKNARLPDPRLLVTLDELITRLKQWGESEFGDIFLGAQIVISDIWREQTSSESGQSGISRHCFGRAIDICGVTISLQGLRSNYVKTYYFNYDDDVSSYTRKIPDLIFSWLKDLGYKQNVPEEPGVDVCYWNYYARARSGSPTGADYNHKRHIHFSVSEKK